MINKKGQAAMEFLMTYGWALLVVLVAIGALAFFGVLNPGQFLPDTCTMPPGIACIESQATTTGITLVLQNGLGDTMNEAVATNGIYSATLSDGTVCTTPALASHASGDTETVVFTCAGLTTGSTVQADITLDYTLASSTLTHAKTGKVAMKVEG